MSLPSKVSYPIEIDGKRLLACISSEQAKTLSIDREAILKTKINGFPLGYPNIELITMCNKFNIPSNQPSQKLAYELLKIIPVNYKVNKFDRYVPPGTSKSVIDIINKQQADKFKVLAGNTNDEDEKKSKEQIKYRSDNLKELQEKGVKKWIPSNLIASSNEETDIAYDSFDFENHDVKDEEQNKKYIEVLLTCTSYNYPEWTRTDFINDLIAKLILCGLDKEHYKDIKEQVISLEEEDILKDENLPICEALREISIKKLLIYGI